MIRVELSILITVYLFLFLAGVFFLWTLHTWSRRRREARRFRHRLQCRLCGMEFEDRTKTPLPRCPRCGNLNERFRKKIY